MKRRREYVFHHPLSWRSPGFRGVATLLVLTLVMRLVWGEYANRRFASQLAAIRATGQPATITDVKIEAVPDPENALLVFQNAAAALRPGVDSPRSSNDDYANYPPYSAQWMKRSATSEAAHGLVFSTARQARGLTRAQFQSQLTSPLTSTLLPFLNRARHLANIVGDGAIYAHLQGDDVEALERTHDILKLSWALREDDFLVSQLVGIGINALDYDSIQIIAPGLRLDAASPQSPAVRRKVKELIAALVDEEADWKQLASGVRFERIASYDFLGDESKGMWAIKPLAPMDAVRTHPHYELAIKAAAQRNKPACEAIMAGEKLDHSSMPVPLLFSPNSQTDIPRYSRWFHAYEPSFLRYFETHFRSIGERRCTAVSLAAQLYRADTGHWPGKLSDLVPQYLPAVPLDPFHDGNTPLGYVVFKDKRPDGAERPMVYFDAGSVDEGPTPEPQYSYEQSRARGHPIIRQYRDLSRFDPPGKSK